MFDRSTVPSQPSGYFIHPRWAAPRSPEEPLDLTLSPDDQANAWLIRQGLRERTTPDAAMNDVALPRRHVQEQNAQPASGVAQFGRRPARIE